MMFAQSLNPSVYVALGGAIGAVMRYQLSRSFPAFETGGAASFPHATLAANVIGSLAMGVLIGWLARHGEGTAASENLRLLLGVGVLGGFTTFSSFSLEVISLIERGQPGLAAIYAGISVAAGVAALFLGLILMRGAA